MENYYENDWRKNGCRIITSRRVEVVFGYPGGAIMNVYDEIYKQNYFQIHSK